MEKYSKMVDSIIKTVQNEALLSGFQYMVDISIIESEFEVSLDEIDIDKIIELLEARDEVADVILDENYLDVVLYTDYAPNYEDEDV